MCYYGEYDYRYSPYRNGRMYNNYYTRSNYSRCYDNISSPYLESVPYYRHDYGRYNHYNGWGNNWY